MLAGFSIPNDPPKAISLLKNALEVYPEDKGLYISLVSAYRSSREWTRSIEWYDAAVKLHPTDLAIRLSYGYTLLTFRRYKMALGEFQY
jgi:tetratricopeptide (TPR) repeat protein